MTCNGHKTPRIEKKAREKAPNIFVRAVLYFAEQYYAEPYLMSKAWFKTELWNLIRKKPKDAKLNFEAFESEY